MARPLLGATCLIRTYRRVLVWTAVGGIALGLTAAPVKVDLSSFVPRLFVALADSDDHADGSGDNVDDHTTDVTDGGVAVDDMRTRVDGILDTLGITDFDSVEMEIDDTGAFEVEVELGGQNLDFSIAVAPGADDGTHYDVRTRGADGEMIRYQVRVDPAPPPPRDMIEGIISSGDDATLSEAEEEAALDGLTTNQGQ